MSAASELIPSDPPKPAKKRKPRKRAKPAAKAKPEADLGEFAGITAQACPKACQGTCIITKGGSGFCAHPKKGGLQAGDMIRPEVVNRFAEARKILEHDAVEKRNG